MEGKRIIAFYDVNYLNLKNYIGDVIKKAYADGHHVVLIFDEYVEEAERYFTDIDCKKIHNHSTSLGSIKKILTSNNVNRLLVNAQRISDSAFVSVAKSMEIKTIMIQHGMYVPFMKRESVFFIKKIAKTIRYLKYVYSISRSIKKSYLSTVWNLVKVFVLGRNYAEYFSGETSLNVDLVFTYGEYWNEFHVKQFGYEKEQFNVIGFHELIKKESVLKGQLQKGTTCYIAQTLVEDGRMDLEEYNEFLALLQEIAKNIKVIVKLHPRSNKCLYENRGFELMTDDLPYTATYCGHYSSLLALAGSISPLVLFEFSSISHKIPSYFSKMGECYANDKMFSESLIKQTTEENSPRGDIEHYFSNNYSVDLVVSKIIE